MDNTIDPAISYHPTDAVLLSAALSRIQTRLLGVGVHRIGEHIENYITIYNNGHGVHNVDASSLTSYLTATLIDTPVILPAKDSALGLARDVHRMPYGFPRELIRRIQTHVVCEQPTLFQSTARLWTLARVSRAWRVEALSISTVYNSVHAVSPPWCAERTAAWTTRVETGFWTLDLSLREYFWADDTRSLFDWFTRHVVTMRPTLRELIVCEGPPYGLMLNLFPDSSPGLNASVPIISWLFEHHVAPKSLQSFTLSLARHAHYFLRSNVFRNSDLTRVHLRLPFGFQFHGMTSTLSLVLTVFPHCSDLSLEDTGDGSYVDLYRLLMHAEPLTELSVIKNLTIRLPDSGRLTSETNEGNACLIAPVLAPLLISLRLKLFSWRRMQIVNFIRHFQAPMLEHLELEEYVTRDELNRVIMPDDPERPIALAVVTKCWPTIRSLDFRSGSCALDIIPWIAELQNLEHLTYHNVSWVHIDMFLHALSGNHDPIWLAPKLLSLDLAPVRFAVPIARMVQTRSAMRGVRLSKLAVNVVSTHCSDDRCPLEDFIWASIGTKVDLLLNDDRDGWSVGLDAGWFGHDWKREEGSCNSPTHIRALTTKTGQ